MTDFTFANGGTVAILTPLSDEARAWADQHLSVEPWQMLGYGIAIEPRCVGAILEGLTDDGLTVREA